MKNQNVAEKYLTQKKTGAVEIIFAVITAIGALLFFMHWRYYGVPALAVGIGGLIFTNAAKIKDAEFDGLIDRIIIDKRIELQKDNVLRTFDAEKEPRVIGKDKSIRTSTYYIAELNYKKSEAQITLHEFDLCKMDVVTRTVWLPYECHVELVESEMMTEIGRKKLYHIVCEEQSFRIPVETDSIDVDNFISHFNK